MARRSKKVHNAKQYQPRLSCEGKRFFSTEAEALEAADIRMLENMSVSIGIYQCVQCHHWHLTSLKDTKPQA